jgi:hypothetical protein
MSNFIRASPVRIEASNRLTSVIAIGFTRLGQPGIISPCAGNILTSEASRRGRWIREIGYRSAIGGLAARIRAAGAAGRF